ncbi:MAG: alpha/beta hydrolase [Betaproteobacteria bacterium]|nr:alpha/beta hydrolase [Betaproteobacteria bacterium]
MLDPQAKYLLDLVEASGLTPFHLLSPADARETYSKRKQATQTTPAPVAEVKNLTMPVAGGMLKLRLYRPTPLMDSPEPALVYYHGGGWTIGDLETHDVLCRDLALQSGCIVIAVDYRLAPEHRFPVAVDDALAAYRWVRGEAGALGVDPGRLAIGGDSAGGNLAAVAALQLRDAGDPPPRLQLLIYPATDMRCGAPSHTTNGQGYLLTADTIAYFRRLYIEDSRQWGDWRASPLLHPNLGNLPPALVLTAGYDPLRDEGRQYADALSAAASPAQYICFERQLHGFITMGKVLDEANTAVSLCAQTVKRALRSGQYG